MKNECAKWKEELLDAALEGTTAAELAEHLTRCDGCSRELATLRVRRERMDALLPMVARGAEPPAGLRARILANVKAKRVATWWSWPRAAALGVVAALLVVALAWQLRTTHVVPAEELAAAQKLVEWRAPSDVLLETPGRQILRVTPKLGESYLPMPGKTVGED